MKKNYKQKRKRVIIQPQNFTYYEMSFPKLLYSGGNMNVIRTLRDM